MAAPNITPEVFDPTAWPQSAYDAAGSGAGGAPQITQSNVTSLTQKWKFDATSAGHPVGPVMGQPVTGYGKTFFCDSKGFMYAVKASNGKLAWQARSQAYQPGDALLVGLINAVVSLETVGQVPNAIDPAEDTLFLFGAPAVAPNRPYVMFADVVGNVYCKHASTGATVWTRLRLPEHPLSGVWGSTLLAFGNTLIVAFGSPLEVAALSVPGYQCCTTRGTVVALNIDTGEEKWRYNVAPPAGPLPGPFAPFVLGPAGNSIIGKPTYDAALNLVFVGTGNGYSPTPVGSLPYVDSIFAIDATTGAFVWQRQVTDYDLWVFGLPMLDGFGRSVNVDIWDSPKVYMIGPTKVVGFGQLDGRYHVINAATGAIMHQTQHIAPVGESGGFGLASAIGGGRVYASGCDNQGPPLVAAHPVPAPSYNGVVKALSLDGTSALWSFTLPQTSLIYGLTYCNEIVYLMSQGGTAGFYKEPNPPVSEWSLWALNAATGAVIKRVTFGGQSAANAATISKGNIFAGFGNLATFGPIDLQGGIVALGV